MSRGIIPPYYHLKTIENSLRYQNIVKPYRIARISPCQHNHMPHCWIQTKSFSIPAARCPRDCRLLLPQSLPYGAVKISVRLPVVLHRIECFWWAFSCQATDSMRLLPRCAHGLAEINVWAADPFVWFRPLLIERRSLLVRTVRLFLPHYYSRLLVSVYVAKENWEDYWFFHWTPLIFLLNIGRIHWKLENFGKSTRRNTGTLPELVAIYFCGPISVAPNKWESVASNSLYKHWLQAANRPAQCRSEDQTAYWLTQIQDMAPIASFLYHQHSIQLVTCRWFQVSGIFVGPRRSGALTFPLGERARLCFRCEF